MVRLLSTYEQVKRDRNVIDFEDVLLYTVGLIAEHRQVADAIRGQYHQLVVDEYQDVSPLQQALLDQWLGDREEVCVVGDPNQTIYTFAGASPDFLLGFRQRHPSATRGAAGARLPLHAAGRRPGQPDRHRQRRTGGAAPSSWSRSGRPARSPTCAALPDEPAEARHVATRVQDLLTGRYAGQRDRGAVPHQRPERDLRAGAGRRRRALRAARRRAVLRPARGARGPAAAARRGPVGRLRRPAGDRARRCSPAAAGASPRRRRRRGPRALGVAGRAGPAGRRPGRCRARAPTLRDFVAELDERADAQHAPTVEGVTLASLHAAKGLEWDAVFVVGATEGMLPITYAETPEQVEEERRLLYVGVTRAREHLSITWSLARAPGGRAGAAAVAVPRRPARVVVPAAGGPRGRAGARARRPAGSAARR